MHDATNNEYKTVRDEHKEYEDPDYYGEISAGEDDSHASRPDSSRRIVVNSLPPLPPPAKPTHLAIHNTRKRSSPRWRVILSSTVIVVFFLILVASIVGILLFGPRNTSMLRSVQDENPQYVLFGFACYSLTTEVLAPPYQGPSVNCCGIAYRSYQLSLVNGYDLYASFDTSSLNSHPSPRRYEVDVSANHLLTLLITKRKVCLLEASTGDEVLSRELYLAEHIETARLLYHTNLSHSGVPVHPLQFQRYTRSLGVDSDCHVIIYDRGQMIWSTYAAWIFKLFGHRRVSILSGGFLAWKSQQARSSQYHTGSGDENGRSQGDLLSSWNQSLVITFDDVLLNTEVRTFDVIDAQTKEEYAGESTGVLYGHISGAVNIPVDSIYDWKSNNWRASNEIEQVFASAGLIHQKPVIVYCSTSLRSSLVWWALKRLNYDARIYFGGWPEWVVRAPDELKVLGKAVGH